MKERQECGLEFRSASKTVAAVEAKEVLILVGRELGAANVELARMIGIDPDPGAVSPRFEQGASGRKSLGGCEGL